MPSPGGRSPHAGVPSGPAEISPGVFLGGWADGVSFDGVRFCVLDEDPGESARATHLPVYDGTRDRPIRENLDRVADRVGVARANGQRVILFCGHGVRRSPLAAAWYLHRTEGIPLAAAYERIRAVRPQIEEAKDWIGDVSNLGEA